MPKANYIIASKYQKVAKASEMASRVNMPLRMLSIDCHCVVGIPGSLGNFDSSAALLMT